MKVYQATTAFEAHSAKAKEMVELPFAHEQRLSKREVIENLSFL